MDATLGIVSTLKRFDKLRQLEQQEQPRSRWTRLVLDDDNDTNPRDGEDRDQEESGEKDVVYLLEPPSLSTPSCIIVFVGGAGLGSFPQVAYAEFLERVSNQLNAAIVTAPYNVVSLDHFQLAKQVGELSRRALLQCEEDPQRLYSPTLPVYCLAHSLGCKLASIYVAATGQDYDGMGFIGFNNYGFARTISMAKDFAQSLQEMRSGEGGADSRRTTMGQKDSQTSETMNQLFNMAETFMGTLGVEFSPTPVDTERLIALKFDPELIAKTRLFVMDEDGLDDSASFLRACDQATTTTTAQQSSLPGNHLTPVYFEFNLNEVDLPESAREVAQSNLGGFESASFGNAQELDALVQEVVGFVMGRPPSTRPTNQPLLGVSSSSSSSE